MKKCMITFLCCLLLTGCAAPGTPAAPAPSNPTQEEVTQTTGAAQTAPTIVSEPTGTTDATGSTAEPEGSEISEFTLYLPNANVDGFDTVSASFQALEPQTVIDLLVANGVLRQEIRIGNVTFDGKHMLADFNAPFLEQLQSYGTTGEYMMLGSVVNSLLSAYAMDTIHITVEGQTMETGHNIYDFPLAYYE